MLSRIYLTFRVHNNSKQIFAKLYVLWIEECRLPLGSKAKNNTKSYIFSNRTFPFDPNNSTQWKAFYLPFTTTAFMCQIYGVPYKDRTGRFKATLVKATWPIFFPFKECTGTKLGFKQYWLRIDVISCWLRIGFYLVSLESFPF